MLFRSQLTKGVNTLEQVNVNRSIDSFQFVREIAKPFGTLDEVIAWCKTALENEWRWQLISTSSDKRPGNYRFYFDSERDYCAFMLRWS